MCVFNYKIPQDHLITRSKVPYRVHTHGFMKVMVLTFSMILTSQNVVASVSLGLEGNL